MKYKVKENVKLTRDQLEELLWVMSSGDIDWEYQDTKKRIFEVETETEEGTYCFRVNLNKELITLLEVKN